MKDILSYIIPSIGLAFGIFGIYATTLFGILKLIGLVEWSWLWVLYPIWISLGLGVAFMMIVGAISIIYSAITEKEDK